MALGPRCGRISLDDFYRDRSHLAPRRRDRLNFDRPDSIDWVEVEKVLRNLMKGRPTSVPCYDFATHCRLRRTQTALPKPIILVDGLWVLRRLSIQNLFSFRIFIECPSATRLKRRLARDLLSRGRTRASILRQFRKTVEPMHQKFVAPQLRRADLVLRSGINATDVAQVASRLRPLLQTNSARSSRPNR